MSKRRQTKKSNLTKKQRKLVRGRPIGTKKRRLFEETRVGYILKYEAPSEYAMIMQSSPDTSGEGPMYEVIKTVASASNDPILKNKRFLSALDDYKKNGLYTRPKPAPTEKQIQAYALRLRKKLQDFIWDNRLIINILST